jgi:FkbM family methyltransferase
MLKKLNRALKIAKLYKNFPVAFLSRIKKSKNNFVLEVRNGTKFILRNNFDDLSVVNDVFITKPYHIYLQSIRQGGTVIDIGANIGAFSILAAKENKQVKVYSLEPFPDNFKMLTNNIKINNLSNQISPIMCAVSSKNGFADMHISDSPLGHSICAKKSSKHIKVETVSLTDFIRKNNLKRIDYLKVDCEGAEWAIVNSLSKSDFAKIRRIALEYHEEYNLGKSEDIKKILERNGFVVYLKYTPRWGIIYAEK